MSPGRVACQRSEVRQKPMLMLRWRNSNAEAHMWCRASVQSTLVRSPNGRHDHKKRMSNVTIRGKTHGKELGMQHADTGTEGASMRGMKVCLVDNNKPQGTTSFGTKKGGAEEIIFVSS